MDIDNFLFCPPERFFTFVNLFSFNPKSLITFEISFSIKELSIDLKAQNIWRCSSTVNSLNNISYCGQIPSTFLNFSIPSGVNILYES